MNKENIIEQVPKNSTEVYRISEKEYEGYRFIDVRIYYMDKTSGEYKPTKVKPSLSPSMDVQVSSNFERLLFDTLNQDDKKVSDLMLNLKLCQVFF